MCSGGYVGAIPYITGDVIHVTGQDDVMTTAFYMESMALFDFNPSIYFVTSNGYITDEHLGITGILINPEYYMDCSKPLEIFKSWFGISPPSYEVSRANNGFLAPGTIYKRKLHDLIGTFDLDNFRGAADFEYWARILFYEYPGQYVAQPNWYYRRTEYTAGNAIIDGKPNNAHWRPLNLDMIKEKYTKLVQQNKDKFK